MQKYICTFALLSFLTACAQTKNVNEGVLRTYPDGSKIEVVHVAQGVNEFTSKPEKITNPLNTNYLTLEETNTFRNQLSRCWSIQAGAKYADDLQVELHVTVGKDRKVKTVNVIANETKLSDPDYLSAVEAAKKAVFTKQCTPLKLPPNKYDTWKNMVIIFDPREML